MTGAAGGLVAAGLEHTEKCDPIPKGGVAPAGLARALVTNEAGRSVIVKITNGCCYGSMGATPEQQDGDFPRPSAGHRAEMPAPARRHRWRCGTRLVRLLRGACCCRSSSHWLAGRCFVAARVHQPAGYLALALVAVLRVVKGSSAAAARASRTSCATRATWA